MVVDNIIKEVCDDIKLDFQDDEECTPEVIIVNILTSMHNI